MLSSALRGRLRLPLADRLDGVELLDGGTLSDDEVEANLADLARLNGLPGGTAASLAAIGRLVGPDRQPSVLDVGTGGADQPSAFARRGWRVVAVDANPAVLRVAEQRVSAAGTELELVHADALSLPFADGAFDVAHASLLLHHLAPTDALRALAELRRVSRVGVVVNDLRRGLLPLGVTWVTLAALARSPVTHRDGLTSVRRAYTIREIDALLDETGLRRCWRSPAWLPRVVTAAVPVR
ncbi:MAG TPA: methyltransferase domain-containing protein [Candidatus Limnocylindria bacterium]|nr:methyltransferase domain-containing protein [Candidatus Limnocylindria bacterium]